MTLGLVAAGAAPAGATVRSAAYQWTPSTGPVAGYAIYARVDGGPEQFYTNVNQPRTVIQFESGASLIVSVAAFDRAGRLGPRSDESPPLRLCPGDFDGDQVIETADVNRLRACLNTNAAGACAGGDLNDDGVVSVADYVSLQVGADACPPPIDCSGDLDHDGAVTNADLFGVNRCFGLRGEGNCASADVDGSGFVTMMDLFLTAQAVGNQGCPD